MTDEPIEQNASGEETAGSIQPDQTATETEVEATAPDQEVAETEETEVKSERGKNRVQQLANKAKVAETEVVEKAKENDSLKDELSKITQPEPSPVGTNQIPPWMQPKVQKPSLGEEVSQEQYWKHVEDQATQKANTIVDLKIGELQRTQLVKENYETDIGSMESDYPEAFNSNDTELKTEFKKQFDLYRKTLAVDPNIRFKDFAGPLLKARSIGVEQGKGEAVSTITTQAGEAAVKPSTSSSDSSTTEEQLIAAMKSGDLSPEEAEKKIAQLQ